MRGSSPQRVVSHLPNIATLRRGTHFSTCIWSWYPRLPDLNEVLSPVLPLTAWVIMFYFMESATIIIFFARLAHFQGEEKKCTFCTLVIMMKKMDSLLKPHCIQSSRVLVPAGTSKSTSRHPGHNQGHGIRCWCSDAVTLSSTMRTDGFELGSSAPTSSTLKWLHRIQCGFKLQARVFQ
jgi:hypothetical protein